MKKKMTRNAMVMMLAVSLSLMTACGVNGTAPEASTAAADGTVASTAAATSANEPTETVAVTTSATTAETTAVTTASTTAALPAVTILAAPATYAASFDTVRIYTDASRTTIQSVLAKGGQVTITGTADKYGVTAEGYYVNLNLMTLVVTATPTPAETTAPAATTKETTKPTPKPTKETTAATEAPAETEAPPAETAAPSWTAPTYAENCDNIRSLIIGKLQEKGLWFPDAEVNGDDLVQLSVGYTNSDDKYATAYVSGKYGTPDGTGATSVSVWIEGGFLNMSSTACTIPAA